VTDEESIDTSRSETWLLLPASVRWPDAERGPWVVTAHWAKVNERAVIVGLDIRSFDHLDAPIGDDLAEVTQRVLRGIPISQIRETTRDQVIAAHMMPSLAIHSAPLVDGAKAPADSMHPEDVAAIDQQATEAYRALTAKGQPRKRRPPATEALLRTVAELYTHAVTSGDKMPAKYVEAQLRAAGEPRLSTKGGRVQVRQWVRRARERGYLTIPPNERA